MAVSFYNIKKWFKMLSGQSVLHVRQGIGKSFSINNISGYYNDLTEKVLKQPEFLDTDRVPTVVDEKGKTIEFPVAIFQYGLGAYDLFLKTSQDRYLSKFYDCVNWAINNQEKNGAWNNFFFIYPETPYGAMCQGEGASLLLRAYIQTNDKKYLLAAKKALDFMLLPTSEGGTAEYCGNDVILLEYTHKKVVLNGWIFALFGLLDYVLISNDNEYKNKLVLTIRTLKKLLYKFDNGYWSFYDLDFKLASSFYHNLHIAQLQAMYMITKDNIFDDYAKKWQKYNKSIFKKSRAFFKKVVQKIKE